MALTLNTDSYISVEEYHEYILNIYGLNISNGVQVSDEANLRRASKYLDSGWEWRGTPTDSDQALEFPRNIIELVKNRVVDSALVPDDIRNACAEVAYVLKLKIDLQPALTTSIKSESITAGEVKSQFSYDDTEMIPRITAIENMISPWHESGTELLRG